MCGRSCKLITLVVLCRVCQAQTALAQEWSEWSPWSLSNLEAPWRSTISEAEFQWIVRKLELTDEQRAVVESLLRDHKEEFRVFTEEGTALQRKLDETIAQYPKYSTEWNEARVRRLKELAPWADRQAALDQAFLDSVELVLGEEQDRLWEEYLDDRRWRMLAGYTSFAPGVHVNLWKVVKELQLPEECCPKVTALLSEYQSIMEGLVDAMFYRDISLARQRWRETELTNRMNEESSRQTTPDDIRMVLRRYGHRIHRPHRSLQTAQTAVRQMNETYAQLIAAELPEDKIQPFLTLYNHAKYEQSYITRTIAHLYADKLRKSDTLTAEQNNAIDTLLEEVARRLEPLNKQAGQASEESYLIVWKKRPSHEQLAARQKLDAIEHERCNLVWDYVEKISAILTPEQQSTIPKPKRAWDYAESGNWSWEVKTKKTD